jgi:hypothetical protein
LEEKKIQQWHELSLAMILQLLCLFSKVNRAIMYERDYVDHHNVDGLNPQSHPYPPVTEQSVMTPQAEYATPYFPTTLYDTIKVPH